MVALLLLSIATTMVICQGQTQLHLPQNPNTIIGIATLLAHSFLSRQLKGMGSVCLDSLSNMLQSSTYQIQRGNYGSPIQNQELSLQVDPQLPANDDLEIRRPEKPAFYPTSLSILVRLVLFILIATIIAVLEILLRKSQRESGIGDVLAMDSGSLLWTALPSVIFALVGVYCASADFDTRSQTPFLRLSQGATFQNSITLDLVNRHTSALFITELRSRSFEALASTLALALTPFLTIFSASLFYASTIPTEFEPRFETNKMIFYPHDGHMVTSMENSGFIVGSLILLTNASYPAFTFEDLAFPSLTMLPDTSLSTSIQSDNIAFTLTLPAVRLGFSNCRLYNASEIQTNFSSFLVPDDPYYLNQHIILSVGVEAEGRGLLDLPVEFQFNFPPSAGSYFASSETSYRSSSFWIWGFLASTPSNNTDPEVRSISALACNYTLQSINTMVTFSGQEMLIDANKPPVPDPESATTSVELRSLDGNVLPAIRMSANNTNFDPFFTILTSSRYAVPVSYLGDITRASTVADSIRFHYRVLMAQYVNSNWRFENYTSANLIDCGSEYLPATQNETTVFDATAYNPTGRSRVVQDIASTRILQTLLAATLICCGTNWFLMRNISVVPRSPTSIANVLALLADGNLDDFLPTHGACNMSLDEISRDCFGEDALFSLGWGTSPDTGEEVLGIRCVQKKVEQAADASDEMGNKNDHGLLAQSEPPQQPISSA